MESIEFDGLASIVEAIREHAEHIAYLFVQDRTQPGHDTPIGRYELHEPDDPGSNDPDATLDARCDAAELWLEQTTAALTIGHRQKRFRVRCMAPKGMAMVHSGQFVVRDTRAQPAASIAGSAPTAPAVAPLALPEADFRGVEHTGTTKSLHALGELYTRFGNLVLGAVHNLQRIHDSTTAQLHQQLQESRAQTDLLVGSILEARASELHTAAEQQAATSQADTRSALARDAIQQIGEAARTLLGQQGLSAETLELLQLLRTSPSLESALNDSAVRALMQQPGQLDQLAALLRAAAREAGAAPQPTAAPEPHPASGGSPADAPSPPNPEVPDGPPLR